MICLCSASESRALLLDRFGVEYIQKSSPFDEEQIVCRNAREFVYLASKGKLEAAAALYGLDLPLLCADTVIAAADGTILRKPKDLEDARRILLKQSGSQISIITSLHYRTSRLLFCNTSAAHYSFDRFDRDDLEAYLQSGEWNGKAGGCMVEGFCKRYIQSVKGLESTAMGLQVEIVLPWIADKREVHVP